MRKKRILAVLLSSAIAFSGMPGNVFAAEEFTQEEGFFGGEDVTENIEEESTTEDEGESVPELDSDAEDFVGFSDGESEDFVAEEEIEDQTAPETQGFADDEGVVESGKCGDDLTYTITGNKTQGYTLTISGTGDMYNYQNDTMPWKDIYIDKLYLDDRITSIGDWAFYHKILTANTLELPKSLKRIGFGSFYDCYGIKGTLVIPNNVISIGDVAFYKCSGLAKIKFPNSLETISSSAFGQCKNLVGKIVIPSNVQNMEEGAFFYCTSITSAIIFSQSENINARSFKKCANLQKIYGYKGTSAEKIASEQECEFIELSDENNEPVEIMSGKCGGRLYYKLIDNGEDLILSVEGSGDMYNYHVDSARGTLIPWKEYQEKITKLEISSEITSIGNYAFSYFSALNGEIIIPNKVIKIGEGAFCGYQGMCERLVIPDNVKEIGDFAFSSIKGIHGQLIIGNKVEIIGKKAFLNCTGFDGDLIIPESVKKIRDYAFEGCKNITGRLILPSKCELGYGVFKNCSGISGTISIPSDFGTSYYGSPLYIPEETFMGCMNISKVEIKGSGTNISKKAFAGCENLSEIILGCKISEISESSFEGCKKLGHIVIPKTCTKIGIKAFDDCSDLIIYGLDDSYAKQFAEDNDISFEPINVIIENQYYTGEKIEPNVKITLGGKELISEQDYSIEYCNNVGIGTATITIEGKGIFACKLSFNFDIIEKQHEWTEWEITKEATCTVVGKKKRECSLCGKIDTEEILATGHNEIILPSMEATCEEDGMTEGKKCSVCGVILERQSIIPALGHSWDDGKVSKEATCIEEGEKTYTCSRCNKNKTENISKIPHSIVIDPEEPATCTKAGKTEGSHCSVCGEIVIPQKIIQPTGEHSWNSGSLVKAALCTQNGEIQYTCTKCGLKRTETVKALGHKKVTDKSIEATCEKEGKTEGSHCSICGEVLVSQKTIPATGHSWSNWITVKNASVSSEGVQQRTCSKCGKLENKNIPKLTPAPTVAPTKPSTITVTKGKTTSVKSDSSWKNVKYSTSNKKVATVDKKGKVKAVAAGTVKITVKSGSQKAVYTIVVPGTTAIKGVKSSVSVKKGKRYTLKPKLSYTEKADKVTYKSSNKKIATVSKKGVIKGKKKGTATITIKSGKITKKCKVKVK